jgi:uncharacterized membrane protein
MMSSALDSSLPRLGGTRSFGLSAVRAPVVTGLSFEPPQPDAATINMAIVEKTKVIAAVDVIAARVSRDRLPKSNQLARPWPPLGFARVYETLLFLHVLAAFLLVVTVVVFSAIALGAPRDSRLLEVANAFWAVGVLGTVAFGIWLALYVDGYDLLDGWILSAIVLWAVATELGRRAQVAFTAAPAGDEVASVPRLTRQGTLMHWLRSLAVLALLVVMIYKPGA